MRTTLTIDDDLYRSLKERAHREGVPFKRLVNRLLRRGLTADQGLRETRAVYRCPTFSMGKPKVDLDRALEVAAQLEDDERSRKLEERK